MKSWFKMLAQNGVGNIDIYDEIGGYGLNAKNFKLQLDALGNVQTLVFKINSPGGDVIDGFAIYNLIKENPAGKVAIIDGYAASIASVVAMAADTIRMPENAFMMIHNPYLYTVGTAGQLRADAELLDKMKANAIRAYQTHSKLSQEEIDALMCGKDGADGTWMSAEEAFDAGFCNEVIEPIQAKNSIVAGKLKIPKRVQDALKGRTLMSINFDPKTNPNKPGGLVPPQGGTMFECPKCGKEHPAEMKFCGACGSSMNADEALKSAHGREVREAVMAATEKETTRVTDISARCHRFNLPREFETTLITEKVPLDEAIKKILDKISEGNTPLKPGVGGAQDIQVGKEDTEKFCAAAGKALCLVSGMKPKQAGIKDEEVAGLQKSELPSSLHSLIRACLMRQGMNPHKVMNMLPNELHAQAVALSGAKMEASSEFPAILADVANKFMRQGYDQAPVTFDQWTGNMEVKDFKPNHLIKMSNFSDIDDIPEGFAFAEGRFSDKQELISVDTKGKKFCLTRKAIINDDLAAFTRAPAAIMQSVRRRQNKDCYDLLAGNSLLGPLMTEDGVRLFNLASHYNLLATSGLPSVAAIGANRKVMRQMPTPRPDKKSATIYTNFTPKYLITGTTNETVIEQVLGAPYDLGTTYSAVTQAPNVFKGKIEPIFDPYLQSLLDTASKGNAWYTATDPAVCGHLTIAYLLGQRVPFLRSMPSSVGDPLGIIWDIFMEWGWSVEDWRSIIYNDGATSA
jgi:ATP-dependent protease ClpP protease subunit